MGNTGLGFTCIVVFLQSNCCRGLG